jgi:hypothetical protein
LPRLLEGGRADLLIGMEESSWLEVKSGPYYLKQDAGKIELAQDVARFANSVGGILIVGLKTKGNPEVIDRVTPVNLSLIRPQQYRGILDGRVFPPVEGLEIKVAKVGSDQGVLYVVVPLQPEELKPFLVHGAIAAGKVEGAFISIVRRRGEASIPTTAPAIHSMLAAGRALLRGTTRSDV